MVRPGELQYMSAGMGVRSEFNASDAEVLHFYQIWILPNQHGLQPRYAQKALAAEDRAGRLQLVASPVAGGGAVEI